MSNLSDLLPAGAGGKQVDFVASGTIASGKPVILNSAGTVTQVAGQDAGGGTPALFETGNPNSIASTFDSNAGKVVICYNVSSTSGSAIVGTVSGRSISYGTAVVFEAANADNITATFDSNSNKVVIAYRDRGNSNYGTAIVGTVSGTSISFGTAVVFESANSTSCAATFDSNSNKVVIAYTDRGNSNYGTAIVGTVSGTAISFGTAVVHSTTNAGFFASCSFDSNSNKVVISYQNAGSSDHGTAIVGTVSGTSISFGTAVVFESAAIGEISSTFDTAANKIVISYQDQGNSFYGTAIVGTVSSTSISFGTAVVFEAANTGYTSAVFDTNAGKVVISYQDNGNTGDATVAVGTVSGTAISFVTPVVASTGNAFYIGSTYDSTNNVVVIAYGDNAASNDGYAVVYDNTSSTNLTSTNFIGISDAAISSAASGSVTIKGGISSNVTGLTANSNYYVQADGTLTTTTSTVLAGKALSSTSINLDYTT